MNASRPGESIQSPEAAARELLGSCLEGRAWPPAALEQLVGDALSGDAGRAAPASQALFGILVEGLSDSFEPRLCEVYAELFSRVIERVRPELSARELVARYARVRRAKHFTGEAERVRTVFVLSRVTLGADVAVTSILLDAAKKRFPRAEVRLVGPRKGYELFSADPRIRHQPVSYGRGASLDKRLAGWPALRDSLHAPNSIVVDPDSRLTQLGLLPVCEEERYYFFESRSYGGESAESLYTLTRRWATATFKVHEARAFIAPAERTEGGSEPYIAISLGVGSNPGKRLPGSFEQDLVQALLERGYRIWIDKGGGGEETERVERIVQSVGAASPHLRAWHGAFAPFASLIAQSRLYLGYDSAGQHVAAASGVPLVTVFAGAVSARMLARWTPVSRAPVAIIPASPENVREVLRRALDAVDALWAGAGRAPQRQASE